MKEHSMQKGGLLIAEPFMVDPHFKRTVVLLCEHANDGSVGFILNKGLDMKIGELVGDFPEFDASVFYGGPVGTDTIHYIHNVGDLLESSHPVGQGIYWGGDFEKLKFLISSGLVQPHNIKFFVGYSGWSNDQLKEEMGYGSWLTGQLDTNYVFNSKPKALWKEVMENMGEAMSVIAQINDNYSWN